jgi:predicted nucleic acid-binding protein
MVLVDTSVWSLALRRKNHTHAEGPVVRELLDLCREGKAVMMGPIRQELLSGIPLRAQFEGLREDLSAFEDLELDQDHYEKAAALSNDCRRHGVQGSPVDYLICAAAAKANIPVFTLDKDFSHIRPYAKIKLHPIRKAPRS